jgi:hypothetical protein
MLDHLVGESCCRVEAVIELHSVELEWGFIDVAESHSQSLGDGFEERHVIRDEVL